jgi:nucleoside-diphosphate-sugar epimerase
MQVIVFGGTGWVGHHIARYFHQAGCQVTIASRGKKNDFISVIPTGIEHLTLDKTRETEMAAVFNNQYDIVIDSVPTEASFDLIHKYARGLKHYIHCSSTGAYAPLPFIPCDETAPYKGFPYGSGWKQKVIVDTKALGSFKEHGFPATVIRPCYITGPGMLPLDNLGGRRKEFISDIINNVPLDLPDNGLALLQPIHVEDLAASFLLAVQHEVSIGQVYNICLEKAVTLNTYLAINAGCFKTKPNINYLPLEEMIKKYGNTINETGLRFLATHMCFDISKARTQLGYRPKHTTKEAIEETALWTAKEHQ